MQYELLVKSTGDDRYDGTIEEKVKTALAGDVGITYMEGGVALMSGDEFPAENNFGLDTSDEQTARAAAIKVANAVGQPVTFYPYGSDTDPATSPHFTVKPGEAV